MLRVMDGASIPIKSYMREFVMVEKYCILIVEIVTQIYMC